MGPDDIIAALVLCLTMFRRLELKSAEAEAGAGGPEQFNAWRDSKVRIYDFVAGATFAKVAVSLGWLVLLQQIPIGDPWFRIVPMFAFLAWLTALVIAYRRASKVNALQRELGIVLRSRHARS